ncbi:MAG: nickel pincer cofactor biosynthesis protein LarB [Syntrophomonadaceae bacterium]|jgi:NCAIR mutase (PurE)-related protein|nr:nickel pincer cofactor biosynthesis protein LarB [Syntrophomonadaceae bacterium]
MNKERLQELLNQIAEGKVTPEEALNRIQILPYEDLGFARIDHHRGIRDIFPEVIFCPGKSPVQVAILVERMSLAGSNVLATRADVEVYGAVSSRVPEAEFHPAARMVTVVKNRPVWCGTVAVITAGTSDISVAEEAAVSLEIMGAEVRRIYDVGVAGLHRLLDKIDDMNQAQVLVVVAGMEGALASVVGGLTARPVIAVPTSIGYGANFGGLSALLSMLNTCAPGVGVVNIDNGYGAAALAFAILKSSNNE